MIAEVLTHFVNVVASRTGQVPFLTQPVSFDLHLEPALYHGVSRELR